MYNNTLAKEVQTKLNVTADGIIGDITLNAMNDYIDDHTENSTVVPIPPDTSTLPTCICIGHSSKEGGAVSKDNAHNEFTYNTLLADVVQDELLLLGINSKIVNRLTHGGGTGMSADIKAVNSFKSKCIVELHANAYNGSATGTETLYWHSSTKGKLLAQYIQDEMVSVLGLADRGLKPIDSNGRGGAVLQGSYYPMVITEPFFIDNTVDFSTAMKKINALGKGIAKGISNFYKYS